LRQAKIPQRPHLLSDNGSSYIAADLAKWFEGQNITQYSQRALSPNDPEQDRALASDVEETVSCLRTISYLTISGPRSKPSSLTTITAAIL
jgi:hypothetical protein